MKAQSKAKTKAEKAFDITAMIKTDVEQIKSKKRDKREGINGYGES